MIDRARPLAAALVFALAAACAPNPLATPEGTVSFFRSALAEGRYDDGWSVLSPLVRARDFGGELNFQAWAEEGGDLAQVIARGRLERIVPAGPGRMAAHLAGPGAGQAAVLELTDADGLWKVGGLTLEPEAPVEGGPGPAGGPGSGGGA